MTTAVHCFAFAGVVGIPRVGGNDLTFAVVQAIKFPLLGRDLLSCTTGAADTSEASAAPAGTAALWVQVELGKRVRYEVTPAGQTLLVAGATSPVLAGETQIQFGQGWQLSVIEAT
jgi:hypothetical protein